MAKEALKKRKADGEKKRKRQLLDKTHVDKMTGVQSNPNTYVEPLLAKSSAKRVKSSEEGGFVNLALLLDASADSDHSFLQFVADLILLPPDCKRLRDIGPI